MESADQKKREILTRLGNDQELLEEIIQVYFEDSPELIEQLRDAIDAGDAKRLSAAAHRLKGLLSNFAIAELTTQAQLLEQCGRRSDFKEARAHFMGLESQLQFLEVTLNYWQQS